MEFVVLMIMILVSLSFMLKLTWLSPVGRIFTGLILALFIITVCDMASSQSRTQIEDWLRQPDLMLDTSVCLTLDVAFQIYFCFLAARSIRGTHSLKERIIYKICLWIPGILIFPTLFSLLTFLIFNLAGVDFYITARYLAVALVIGIPATALLIKYALPEADLRLELIFMLNIIIAVLGIMATVNGRTAVTGGSEIDWRALAGIMFLVSAGLFAGLPVFHYNIRNKISKIK